MNTREFFDAVKSLRAAQRHYMAHRDGESLAEAKRLCRLVDDEIERAEGVLARQKARADYEKMAEENPALDYLRDKFDLEITE